MAGRRALAVLLAVLGLGAGGYVAADVYDVAPGRLTLAPPPATPAPFPTAPGALDTLVLDVPLPQLDPDAQTPAPAAVTSLAEALVADPRMGSSTGVVVADVLTGEVLADVGGARPRTPASTAKLLTELAAIRALGPERTLSTRVVQPEPGRIVLVGGGDMLLSAGAGDPEAVNGRAGLADLAAATARQLRLAGTTEVSLGLDDSLFTGPARHAGWRPSYLSSGYVAPVAALAVDVARTRDAFYAPRYADPAMQAAQVFADLLAAQGITVGRPTSSPGAGAAPQLAAVESAPMREIVRLTVQESDNTLAEVLGRLVALERGLPGSFSGATSAVVAEAAAEGIDVSGVVIADCSGLADGSAIPARTLVDLLLLASRPGNFDLLPVVLDLPISGWQGTLAGRFGDGPARGLVRAKTGSLPRVTALAGTLQTQSDRLLVFAVLADATPPGGQLRPQAAIDEFCQQLAGLA